MHYLSLKIFNPKFSVTEKKISTINGKETKASIKTSQLGNPENIKQRDSKSKLSTPATGHETGFHYNFLK